MIPSTLEIQQDLAVKYSLVQEVEFDNPLQNFFFLSDPSDFLCSWDHSPFQQVTFWEQESRNQIQKTATTHLKIKNFHIATLKYLTQRSLLPLLQSPHAQIQPLEERLQPKAT